MLTTLNYENMVRKVADTLIRAASSCTNDKVNALSKATEDEIIPQSAWAMTCLIENAHEAENSRFPLCDDTGIPHLILETGKELAMPAGLLSAIYEGVALGLKDLPGRPMAVKGNDKERIEQSAGLSSDPSSLPAAPLMLISTDEKVLRLHILMQGGGPEIRAKTYRVFHKHRLETIIDEISDWASESVKLLGCTPCTLAVGIGRSHYEASSLMLQAMLNGNYDVQNDTEHKITESVNKTNVGPLGLHGKHTVLATFLKTGPQRASGVRIVCMRPCCCIEPRKASCVLIKES
ncbi:MAG: fumarate hydratase [Lachnospiraceae bacterium]|jgi:fumarate hydratase subunit alpha|nr:fumarate hydratase [Lachnospiraceae bacterium]